MIPGIVAGALAASGGGGGAGLEYVGGKVVGTYVAGATRVIDLTDLTGGLDSAPQAGDLVIVAWGWSSTSIFARTVASPGYTQFADLVALDTYRSQLGGAYKVLTSAETSVEVSSTNFPDHGFYAAIHVWRGVDPVTPMDVAPVTATGLNSSRSNPPAITPVTAGAVVVAVGEGGITNDLKFTSSDLQNFFSVVGTNTYEASIGIGSLPWGGSGPIDPAQFGNTYVGSIVSWCAFTIALRPW